jgi:hypothetical protein
VLITAITEDWFLSKDFQIFRVVTEEALRVIRQAFFCEFPILTLAGPLNAGEVRK